MFKKVVTLAKNPSKKAKFGMTMGSVAAVMAAFAPMALASVDMKATVDKILDVIFQVFFYIGLLLLAWSIGMLVLAFKNEDADSKSRAMMLLVVSVALLSVKTLINSVIGGLSYS